MYKINVCVYTHTKTHIYPGNGAGCGHGKRGAERSEEERGRREVWDEGVASSVMSIQKIRVKNFKKHGSTTEGYTAYNHKYSHPGQ